LFVITGRADSTGSASGCNAVQENFASQQAANNVIFRIPTPVFGLGLLEEITDQTILQNVAANGSAKAARGISGRVNRNGNDGRITRFGWKAQNPTGLVFSGEAYNVEMGITNEAFQTERDETPECQFARLPNDTTNTDGATPSMPSARSRSSPSSCASSTSRRPRRPCGRREFDRRGVQRVQQHRLQSVPHSDAHNGQCDGRSAAQQAGESLLRSRAPQHGAGTGGRCVPGDRARR